MLVRSRNSLSLNQLGTILCDVVFVSSRWFDQSEENVRNVSIQRVTAVIGSLSRLIGDNSTPRPCVEMPLVLYSLYLFVANRSRYDVFQRSFMLHFCDVVLIIQCKEMALTHFVPRETGIGVGNAW